MACYLSEADVAQVLNMRMALDAVDAAHQALARGEATDMPRRRVRASRAMQHLLQAAWPARGVMGYKAYTTSAAGARFWLHLFNGDTGEPLAVIEADRLGMMRTGAAGGLAARCLARPDAQVAGIIGAGWQARGQMAALAAVRPLAHFKVFARRADKLNKFCAEMEAELGIRVEPVNSAEAAVRGSDIIVTATTAAQPVLQGAWLADGMHVNAMGSNSLARRELDEAAVSRADLLCVDARETALLEAGDLVPGLEKGRFTQRQLVELGELLTGSRPGRQSDKDVSVFESQGLAIQDVALGLEVLRQAKLSGLGQTLPY
ncbi:ornithine cyclodeaminase family protein [Uliginosibacterium sp. H3]|uniref:Ornithine cyclodeaminase family protein n=1 Tax=Uliginosibacterium silvisoli TaxID=3114758 RepID=A0ABU6K659_9RHOO|nr:ornithine cyclodeaminase family protein [Uliginosibacterium sp. H3]